LTRLILKSVLLALPFILIVALIEYRLRRVPNEYSSTKAEIESKAGEVEVLITGTSHAHDGVAREFLSFPAINLGKGSQSLYYDTQLVSKYVDSMPKLKLVIFGISYHALEYRLMNSVEHWRSGFYYQVYGIPSEDKEEGFNLANYSYIALYTPKEAVKRATQGFLGAAETEAKPPLIPGMGPQGEVSDVHGRLRVQAHEMQMRQGDIRANIVMLESVCALLKQRKVSVVFITVPTYHTYYDHMNPTSYERMQKAMKEITEETGAPYINYLRDDRFTTEDFVNSDHLNKRGAEKFSRILNEDVINKYVRR